MNINDLSNNTWQYCNILQRDLCRLTIKRTEVKQGLSSRVDSHGISLGH